MFLKRVQISHFKSINDASVEFGTGFNVITGANGIGKSNMLDAICFALSLPLKV